MLTKVKNEGICSRRNSKTAIIEKKYLIHQIYI